MEKPKDVTKGKDYYTFNNKIYVPPTLQDEITQHTHSAKAHGHFGIAKTSKRLRETYDFPGLLGKVKEIIKKCTICAKSKASQHKPYGQLQPLPIPEKRWSSISLDFIVKLPPSTEPATGTIYDSILVIIDRLTKYGHFIPYKEATTAEELSYLFLKHITSMHGLPDEIISDRGSTFTSKFWQSLMQQLGAHHKLSTAYHPQTDGQTERLNRTLEQYLRCYVNYPQDNWVSLLPLAQFAYNSAVQESTGISPFYANYGFQPEIYRTPREATIMAEKAQTRVKDLHEIHEHIRHELAFVQQRMKHYANQKRLKGPIFKREDKVYLLRRNIKTKRPSDKLDYKKLGPFTIEKVISETNYRLSLPKSMRIHPIFHISLLEPADPDAEQIQETIEVAAEHEEEHEVDRVLDTRDENGKIEYLIHWKGYSHAENTWEPPKNLKHCQQLVREFHLRNPDRPNPGGRPGKGPAGKQDSNQPRRQYYRK